MNRAPLVQRFDFFRYKLSIKIKEIVSTIVKGWEEIKKEGAHKFINNLL